MSSEPSPPAQPPPAESPVISCRAAGLPPPVTRAERIAVLSGYLLLAGGLPLLPWLLNQSHDDKRSVWLVLIATALGAAVTAFCYINNAVRRM